MFIVTEIHYNNWKEVIPLTASHSAISDLSAMLNARANGENHNHITAKVTIPWEGMLWGNRTSRGEKVNVMHNGRQKQGRTTFCSSKHIHRKNEHTMHTMCLNHIQDGISTCCLSLVYHFVETADKHYVNLIESCRLRGMPSGSSWCPFSPTCLPNFTGKELDKPSDKSFVLWRRKVPERIVTKPHISVTICVGFCRSQSLNMITLASIVHDVNMT